MEKIEKCECYIGIKHDYEDTRLVTLKQLKDEIEWLQGRKESFAEYGIKDKTYSLSDYCDKRKSTDLTQFNYCPLCGKKIDWKSIKGGAVNDD